MDGHADSRRIRKLAREERPEPGPQTARVAPEMTAGPPAQKATLVSRDRFLAVG